MDRRCCGRVARGGARAQRRALIEQLRRYDSYTQVIDLVGKGTLAACDRALQ
jgi:hypothetical protein